MDSSGWAFSNAGTAMCALLMINDCQSTFHGYSVVFTRLEALPAADAANTTILSGLSSRPFVAALNGIGVFVLRNDADKIFGALFYT